MNVRFSFPSSLTSVLSNADEPNLFFFKDQISMNVPPLTQHISIPKDMSTLSCEAFTAGIVEGVLDGLDFVRLLCVPLSLFLSWFLRLILGRH